MVTTRDLRPCHEAALAACHACFPEVASGKFFLRAKLIQQLLQAATTSSRPAASSAIVTQRVGLAPARISVIENLLPPRFERLGAAVLHAPDPP
jgi:hypothetical protein